MSFITITKGRSDVEIPDGVYIATLIDISDPRTVTAQRGPRAGSDVDLLDWTFALDDLEGATIDASTSTASGPKSKLFAFLTALFGGQAPPIGTQLEKDQLIGRSALATIQTDEGGWPRIINLGALPRQAAPRPAPVVPTNSEAIVKNQAVVKRHASAAEAARFNAEGQIPVAAAVAVADDDLPF